MDLPISEQIYMQVHVAHAKILVCIWRFSCRKILGGGRNQIYRVNYCMILSRLLEQSSYSQ